MLLRRGSNGPATQAALRLAAAWYNIHKMEPSSKHQAADEDLHDLRAAAVHVVKKLVDAGFVAYFAGGCVRDRLMGHEPTDYDVATNATPQNVAKIFPKVQTVGESFGVMLVRVRGHMIQVATFRTEGVYSDGR